MAKRISGNIGLVDDTATTNYIKQIYDGSINHDLALTKGITFFNGDAEVSWDGTQELEVVIPTLGDIVANPVTLKGVVNQASDIPSNPSNGDLLYIGTTGEYFNPTVACEAGDMAVYYNQAWHVISGENQVSLAGSNIALTKVSQNVITVEGQTLALAIDYADVRNNVKVTTNATNTISVMNGTVTVEPKYIGLSQAAGSTVDITTSVSIDLPTQLADGTVTINESVLQAADFVFTSGAYPTITKNSASIAITATQNATVAASGNGSFVTDVTAIKGVSFDTAATNVTAGALAYTTGISATAGASFVNGVHVKASDEEAVTAFTAWGQATVATSSFVSGLGAAADSGDLVSSITIGAVTLGEGSDILTGLSKGGNSVITSVSFGTIGVDTDKNWFVSGLGEGNDVVTNVSVGAVSIVADANSTFAGSAVTSASVSNHVLSFTTGSFMTPVGLSKAADTITKGGFTKSGVQLSGTSASSDTFTKGAISQAATTISYKDVLFDNVTLSQASVDYVFDKAASTTYTALTGYVALSVSAADVSKNGAVLENKDITAYIPANAVAVDVTAGTLPTFAVNAATGSLTASVGTALSTSNVSWLAVDASKKDIAVAGAYSLVEVSEGGVEVAAASTYSVSAATVTIAEGTYVNGVLVDGTAVGVSTNA